MKNRINKKIIVKDTLKYGKGVFANEDIKKGSIIYTLTGEKIDIKEFAIRVNSKKEEIDDPFQFGRRTYFDLDNLSRTFNHSCDPNAGIRKNSELFAIKDIKKGGEITYDYSLTISPTLWKMKCNCNSANCRKIISDILSIPKKRLSEYKKLGALQIYMKKILKEIDKKNYKIPKYELLSIEETNNKERYDSTNN